MRTVFWFENFWVPNDDISVSRSFDEHVKSDRLSFFIGWSAKDMGRAHRNFAKFVIKFEWVIDHVMNARNWQSQTRGLSDNSSWKKVRINVCEMRNNF